jgi:hypothetical protein
LWLVHVRTVAHAHLTNFVARESLIFDIAMAGVDFTALPPLPTPQRGLVDTRP